MAKVQLNLLYEYFPQFQALAERTWPCLRILNLDGRGGLPGKNLLALHVQDSDFVAEIGWMGHGLQMWLQMIWFLVLTEGCETIILDEPDVYLHADLQRKLVLLLKSRNRQVIIATHSLKIISEADPYEILIVDKRRKTSAFATSLKAVQRVVDHIGGVQNLQLTRLWASRRCLLVEGKYISLLKILHAKLFPDSEEPLDSLPHMSIGGWGGWGYALGSAMLLKNAGGETIITYCILDSDYHRVDEISQRYEDAKRLGVELHIWKRKEIENYLLVPRAIARLIDKRMKDKKPKPSAGDVQAAIEQITEQLHDVVFDAIADAEQSGRISRAPANTLARQRLGVRWGSLDGRLYLVSGKEVLSQLSSWSTENYGVSFSVEAITREILPGEIHDECKDVLRQIEKCMRFDSGKENHE